jgi:hypothetical protein
MKAEGLLTFCNSPLTRQGINDVVNQLKKVSTSHLINNVGAKHSGDQLLRATKISLSECFALPRSNK